MSKLIEVAIDMMASAGYKKTFIVLTVVGAIIFLKYGSLIFK